MKIEQKIYLIELYDIYSSMLSTSQKNIFHDYYLYDLSLQEIASNLSISRSGVEDALKKAKNKLIQLEDKLHIHEMKEKHNKLIEDINNCSSIEEIKELINKYQ